MDISKAFVWGEGGQATTPEEVQRRRKLAQALLERGGDFSPVQHWTQGAARVANALSGALQMKYASDDEAASKKAASEREMGLVGGLLGGEPSVPAAGAAASAPKMPPDQVKAIIDANVPEADREYAYRMAQKESNFDPNAVSPTGAKGLFQFTGGTGKQYGLVGQQGDMRTDPALNTQAFVKFTNDNREGLRKVLGRDPTPGELAVAHQQGLGGATALLTGKGTVNPANLAVQANKPKNAQDIMRYYGYDGAPAVAQAPDVLQGGGGTPQMVGGDTLQAPAAPAGGSPAPAAPGGQGKVTQAILGRAMSVLNDPYSSEGGKAAARLMVQQALTPQSYTYQTLPDGTILRMDPRGGAPQPVYQAPTKPSYGVVGKDQFGNEQYGWIDPVKQSITPAQTPGAQPSGAGVGPNGRPMVPGPDGQPIEVPEGADPKAFRTKMTDAAAEKANGPKAETISELRKETQQLPSYKNYAQAIPAYNSVVDAAKRDTKAADLNLVYGLAKIMDPGSVVREGELQMANDTQGVAERLIGMVKSINGGARLGPKARAALLAEATSRMNAFRQSHDEDVTHYGEIADAMRIKRDLVLPRLPKMSTIDPKDIAGDPANDGETPASAPKGPVTDGRPVPVKTPDEARRLPKGTRILLPDGTEGVVP
jgi:hypothetical protein